MTAYYDKDSLVLINSLTDAEAAGTDTFYFLKNGTLIKVFIVNASFDANDEWKDYYSKHQLADKCYTCHGKSKCSVTEIAFVDRPVITRVDNKRKVRLTRDEKDKILSEINKTCEELKILVKDIQ